MARVSIVGVSFSDVIVAYQILGVPSLAGMPLAPELIQGLPLGRAKCGIPE